MSRSTRFALILGLAALLLPAPCLARGPGKRPGHDLIGEFEDDEPHLFDDDPAIDPLVLIQQRLAARDKKSRVRGELQDFYKKLLKNPELLNSDPATRKKLEELLKNSGLTLDPNDPRVKRLKEWLKNRPPNSTATPPLSPEAQEELKKLLDALKKSQANPPEPVTIPELPPPPTPPDATTPPPPIIDEAERKSRRDFTEFLLQQVRKIDQSRFRDSELGRQIRNDLTRFASNGLFRDDRRWAIDGKLGQRFADLTKDMRSPRLWSNVKLPMPSMTLPRGSMPGLPNFSGWGRPPSLGTLPGVGAPGMPSAKPPSGETLLWFLATVALGIVVWRLLVLYAPWAGRSRPGARIAIPWPTHSGAVATKADLIRAFECLSIAILGPESRTWNHLEVAARLGGEAADRREAADTLGRLYEQARYIPDDSPLSADAVAAAQRSFSLLAGGASA